MPIACTLKSTILLFFGRFWDAFGPVVVSSECFLGIFPSAVGIYISLSSFRIATFATYQTIVLCATYNTVLI